MGGIPLFSIIFRKFDNKNSMIFCKLHNCLIIFNNFNNLSQKKFVKNASEKKNYSK